MQLTDKGGGDVAPRAKACYAALAPAHLADGLAPPRTLLEQETVELR